MKAHSWLFARNYAQIQWKMQNLTFSLLFALSRLPLSSADYRSCIRDSYKSATDDVQGQRYRRCKVSGSVVPTEQHRQPSGRLRSRRVSLRSPNAKPPSTASERKKHTQICEDALSIHIWLKPSLRRF